MPFPNYAIYAQIFFKKVKYYRQNSFEPTKFYFLPLFISHTNHHLCFEVKSSSLLTHAHIHAQYTVFTFVRVFPFP